MAVFLFLGPVKFSNFEIPEHINFGGEQALAVKELVGGQRVIDAMGRRDDDITWSGLFFGSTAAYRARFIDGMRVAGEKVLLTWSEFSYEVVIRHFRASFEREYQLPYEITCTVVQDLNKPFPVLLPVAYDDAIENAIQEANDLAATIGNSTIIGKMASLNVLLSTIPSLSNATSSVIGQVVVAVLEVEKPTLVEISSLNTQTFTTMQTNDQIASDINTLSQLYSLESILQQTLVNLKLTTQGSNGTVQTVNAVNLYALAAEHYGDATQWTTIAEANGFFDPEVSVPQGFPLIIPQSSNQSGGLITL